jgi:hypothetical protein
MDHVGDNIMWASRPIHRQGRVVSGAGSTGSRASPERHRAALFSDLVPSGNYGQAGSHRGGEVTIINAVSFRSPSIDLRFRSPSIDLRSP